MNVVFAINPHTISRALDTRAGSDVTNYDDKQVDASIDRMRAAATDEAFRQAGDDFQRDVVENTITTSVSSFGLLQAASGYMKGYENLHSNKLGGSVIHVMLCPSSYGMVGQPYQQVPGRPVDLNGRQRSMSSL